MELTGQSRDVFKLFWSAQQRFFKLLCISMKACFPAVILAQQGMHMSVKGANEAALCT